MRSYASSPDVSCVDREWQALFSDGQRTPVYSNWNDRIFTLARSGRWMESVQFIIDNIKPSPKASSNSLDDSSSPSGSSLSIRRTPKPIPAEAVAYLFHISLAADEGLWPNAPSEALLLEMKAAFEAAYGTEDAPDSIWPDVERKVVETEQRKKATARKKQETKHLAEVRKMKLAKAKKHASIWTSMKEKMAKDNVRIKTGNI